MLHNLFRYHYLTLILWTVPLLFLNSQQASLMAHDEGIYTWRSRLILDTGGWLNPEIIHYGKTPGIYWFIASSFGLFGVSEFTARLPTIIFSLISVFLLYEIVKITIDRPTAWLAAAIVSVESLWLQYSRLAVPDVPTVCFFLLALWSVLKAEFQSKNRTFWLLLAGTSLGLGFLVRSYMIFVPTLALVPYLLSQRQTKSFLLSPWLYLGFCLGMFPTLIWLFAPLFTGKESAFFDLFNFMIRLNSEERNNNNFFYYFWNVPLRAFPWSLFAIWGSFICWQKFDRRCRLLFVVAPVLILVQLSIFSTRIPHYAMSLYPFVAILAAIASIGLTKNFDRFSLRPNKALQLLSYLGGGSGLLLVIASIIAYFFLPLKATEKNYLIVAFALGLGWSLLLIIWGKRDRFRYRYASLSRFWIGSWLLGTWLALAISGYLGFWSNYNPDFKNFTRQPNIAAILTTEKIYSVGLYADISSDKIGTLLLFYTPDRGKDFPKIEQLPKPCHAWVRSQDLAGVPTKWRSIGKIGNWQLIQLK